MSKEGNKLGDFLREVSNWNWEDFCRAEQDPKYTSNEALIFALVRACAMEKIDAIKLALNRLDGKLKTPIRVEYPKIFIVYPRAGLPEGDAASSVTIAEETPQVASGEVLASETPSADEEPDIKDLSLRQTLTRMGEYPREVPDAVIVFAEKTQQWLNNQGEEPEEKPMVKSVMAAHLLKMAQRRDTIALDEVFNQVDGKLVETLKLLGEDMYITSYSTIAPPDAYVNKDGILQIEAVQAQNIWAQKLGQDYGA